MANRKDLISAHCLSRHPSPRYLDSKIPVVSKDNHFFHCPIAKAASTFWHRFVLTLNTSGPMQTPFTYHLKKNTPLPKVIFSELGSKQERLQFLQKSYKSLFVRDPYSRMFSAYVDKILGPNPYFWKEWGTYWRRLTRGKLRRTKNGPMCYHNLTFSEVMAVAGAYLHKTDLHFVPASKRCQPCGFHYDFIGKMETFSQDLRHISKSMNLSLTDYFSSDQFRFDYAKDAIEDSINSPFGWLKDIYKCINKYDMGLRIWRKLQIRGLVDRRIPFPYSREEFRTTMASQFIEASVKAYLNSTDREELKRQKREAFVEAYRTVDMKVLEKMESVLMDDFLMFGYESAPEDVFDRRQELAWTGAFNWSVPWTGM